jgi:hypothetical protein
MTMTNHTATVEALTAEVRILMVGSRQVTMSVYGQLDHVNYDEIEPFGRVLPKDAQNGHVYVIGKRAGSGDLVSSWLPCTEYDIERWIAASSSAALHAKNGEKEEDHARRYEHAAAKLEEMAGKLLSDEFFTGGQYGGIDVGPSGAAHYESVAARHDQEAKEAELEASSAADEVTRLKATSSAASYRYSAACERRRAEERRNESAALIAKAEDARAKMTAHLANANTHYASADECTQRDNHVADAVTAAADIWRALPLIVLAGLR